MQKGPPIEAANPSLDIAREGLIQSENRPDLDSLGRLSRKRFSVSIIDAPTDGSTTYTPTDRASTSPSGSAPLSDLEHARALVAAGIPVFVAMPNRGYDPEASRTLPDGKENPDAKEMYLPPAWESRAASESTLRTYEPGRGLCLLAGFGVDGVDVDAKHGADVAEHRARLETLGVRILAEVRTPSGGAHFYVRSAGICSTSRPVVGVDYRGRGQDGTGGGFLYLPGTSRPKYAGAGYEWVRPFDPADLEDLGTDPEQVDAVATYLAGLGVNVRTRREHAPVDEIGGESLEGRTLPEWLLTEVADLGPDWPSGAGDRSARFHHLVGASLRAGLTQGQTVTLLDPWCSGTGKFIGRVAGEVARSWPKVKADADRNRPAQDTPTEGKDSPGGAPEDGTEALEWDVPVPLAPKAPAPVDISGLPDLLREVVEAVTEQSQSPREVVTAAVLGTLAAATRGAWDVQVHDGWNAGPTCLWTTTLAPSGERKGAGQEPIVAPLREAERAIGAEVRRANRNRETERKRLQAAIKAAENDGDLEQVERLTDALHAARSRAVPLLVISDTTPEALGAHMTEQGGACAIFSTEATAFRTVAGAYSDAGGNLGLLNHAYDAEAYSDIRLKRAGARVDRPALSWCTAVQPEVMSKYAGPETEGSGFLARFLFLVPESRVGSRNMRTTPVPEHITREWARVVDVLHAVAWQKYSVMVEDLPDTLGTPARLHFEPDAAETLLQYMERLEARKVPGSDLVTLGGWIEKHPARVARIAAVLALAENPHRHTVPLTAVQAALSLAEAFIAHALAAFSILRGARGDNPEHRVVEALRRIGKPQVSTREVWRAVKGQAWAERVGDVRLALEGLEVLGYVHGPLTRSTGGRPSEEWAVNPLALGEQSPAQ